MATATCTRVHMVNPPRELQVSSVRTTTTSGTTQQHMRAPPRPDRPAALTASPLLLLRLLFIALTTLSLTSVLACKSRRGVFQLLFVIVVQFGESKLLFYEELVKFVLSKRTCMVSSQTYSCVRAEKQAQENKT
jgi:hypothetical protein